jgi:predicted nuclease with TOPRIM domain
MVILKLRIHDLMKINEEMRAELNEAKGVILKHEQEMTQLKRELEEVREKLHVELSQMNPRLDSIFSLLNDRMSDF